GQAELRATRHHTRFSISCRPPINEILWNVPDGLPRPDMLSRRSRFGCTVDSRAPRNGSPPGARIAGGWWRVVLRRGRAEQFGEDGLQPIRPHLVTLEGEVQLVAGVHHSLEQLAIPGR